MQAIIDRADVELLFFGVVSSAGVDRVMIFYARNVPDINWQAQNTLNF